MRLVQNLSCFIFRNVSTVGDLFVGFETQDLFWRGILSITCSHLYQGINKIHVDDLDRKSIVWVYFGVLQTIISRLFYCHFPLYAEPLYQSTAGYLKP